MSTCIQRVDIPKEIQQYLEKNRDKFSEAERESLREYYFQIFKDDFIQNDKQFHNDEDRDTYTGYIWFDYVYRKLASRKRK